MKKYLAVFVAPIEAYDKMKVANATKTPEQRKADMDKWMAWMEKHKADFADPGGGVGAAKRVTKEGITDVRNEIGGYMIVQAESLEAAAKVFVDSPEDMPEARIEVMEIMSM